MRWVMAVLPMVLASGCNNACQQLCVQLANYAEECGYDVADSEVNECIQSQAGGYSLDSLETCSEFNDPDTVRQEWSCADVGLHFDGSTTPTDTEESSSDAPTESETSESETSESETSDSDSGT